MTLLSGTLVRLLGRCGKLTQQSIDDGPCAEQFCKRSEAPASHHTGSCGEIRRLQISPFGRDERATAIGQDYEQVRTTLPMDAPMDGKALTFKGMMRTRDGDAQRKVFVMGSV